MTDCEHSPTMRLFAINTVPGADGCPICLAAENAALKAQLAYAASTGDECAIEVEALRKDAERWRRVYQLSREISDPTLRGVVYTFLERFGCDSALEGK